MGKYGMLNAGMTSFPCQAFLTQSFVVSGLILPRSLLPPRVAFFLAAIRHYVVNPAALEQGRQRGRRLRAQHRLLKISLQEHPVSAEQHERFEDQNADDPDKVPRKAHLRF